MNLELVEQIVAILGEHPVSEITVEQEGRRVCVRRTLVAAPASAAPPPAVADAPAPGGEPDAGAMEEAVTLTAPMVGLFHHADPPLPYGAKVTRGQVVGAIESMKLMNDVAAEAGGRLTDILIEDGAPVEYGQPLFRLSA
jgi:biotin carboxyl carrier protein